jgi:hypothetical protein
LKKQQKTYILLIAVLGIWGAIGYQIYVRMNPPAPKIGSLPAQSSFQRQSIKTQSFYQLQEPYRDPFLGKFPKKKATVQGKKRVFENKPTIPFPNVIYNGMIEGNSTSYILTVNGKQEILEKGATHQNVKLISATKEEAIVQFQKERKTIVKQ